jgi:hypothetical protein
MSEPIRIVTKGISDPVRIVGGVSPITPWYLASEIPAANCVAIYQPKGAASYAASKVNLITPGILDCIDDGGVKSPIWNAIDGWVATTNAQYLKSYISPPAVGQPWSMLVRCSGLTTNYICGIFGVMGYWGVFPDQSVHIFWIGNSDRMNIPGTADHGVFGFAGNKAYWNGIEQLTNIPALGAMGSIVRPFGASPSFKPGAGAMVQAEVWYSTVLTPAQMFTVSNLMMNL